MESTRHLIVGAGMTGLATAAFLRDPDYLILEGDREIGGYCKTIERDGFTWDYSGHFFHFKDPSVEDWLRQRMKGQNIRNVEKKSFIRYRGLDIDFPFQKNIHQLPREEFIECLHDLYFAAEAQRGSPEASFLDMLEARFGRAIADKFLIPYNEKLYACDLRTLDKDAMGRFFPHAQVADIIRNMQKPDNQSYNSRFTYPEGGAIQYVRALASEVRADAIALEEPLVELDLRNRVAVTPKRRIRFERLVSSIPFHKLAALSGLAHDPSVFTWNKVLVFNLGFDKKGPTGVHWTYFPARDRSFYRIGFYDNIFDGARMSLYVELGFDRHATIDVDAAREQVLRDLRAEGIVTDHRLVAEHHVVMDPAYVHITKASIAEHRRLSSILRANGVYSAGRYGGWTYCSIEDNILEARALTSDFNAA